MTVRPLRAGMVAAEDAATDAPDHRAVPPHQRFGGRSLSAAHEALQQLFQLDLLRQVGFAQIEVLHKNVCFAAFGAVKG